MPHKHTQGPWKNEGYGIYAREKYLASVYSPITDGLLPTEQEARANARLIAAAPDLLAALQSLTAEVSFLIHGKGDNQQHTGNELRNSLALLKTLEK